MKLLVLPTIESKKEFLAPVVKTDGAIGADVPMQADSPDFFANPDGIMARKIGLGMKVLLVSDDLTYNFPFILAERSGLCLKKNIRQANSIGIIDADYRGELGWLIETVGITKHSWSRGERLCQIVPWGTTGRITEIRVVDSFPPHLEKTTRGAGGFGSTGT